MRSMLKKVATVADKLDWTLIAAEETSYTSTDEDISFADVVSTHAAYLEKMFEDWTENVEAYKADIFYDVMELCRAAEELDKLDKKKDSPVINEEEYALHLFGIRSYGVDGVSFIECRMPDWEKEYTGVYKAVVTRLEKNKFVLRLYKADSLKGQKKNGTKPAKKSVPKLEKDI